MKRRFLISAGVGAFLATLLFAVVLQSGRSGIVDRDLLGNFYDGQARALMDGHLDVPPDVPGFEGFRIGDRTHIYQPIVPALARVPLFALTDRFDGRLTGLSMLAAFVVAMGYTIALGWRLRRSIVGSANVGALEALGTGFVVFGIGAGSLVFLAGKTWVYHEGLLWATALCLGSFTHLVNWVLGAGPPERRRRAQLVASVVLAGLALNTRSTIGFGPVAALGLTAAALLVAQLDRRAVPGSNGNPLARTVRRVTGWDPTRSTSTPGAALAVIVVGVLAAVVLYAGVNHARFGSLFGVPLDKQVLVADDPERQAALDANDNSLFGPQYVPSVLLQVLRPNALDIRSDFPYLGFPTTRPSVIGDAVFSELDWSTSVPVGQPLLAMGGLLGLAALVVPRRILGGGSVVETSNGEPEFVAIRIPAAGAALGGGVFIAFGYIAQRYLTDLFPLLVICTLVGLHAMRANFAARSSEQGGRHRMVARALVGAIALTALWGAWVNTSLALQYQQEISPGRTRLERIEWLRTQQGLPGSPGEPLRLTGDEALPLPSEVGRLAVVGECDALYRGNGGDWYLLESTPPAGGATLTVRRDGPLDGPVPIARLVGDDSESTAELIVEPLGGDDVRLTVRVRRGDDITRSWISSTFALVDGASVSLDVTMDWRTGDVVASGAGTDDERLQVRIEMPPGTLEPAGSGPLSVTAVIPPTPRCDQLTG